LSESTGIKDIDKLDNLADAILDNIKKNARIDTSDDIRVDISSYHLVSSFIMADAKLAIY
jgi:hypothetical protein